MNSIKTKQTIAREILILFSALLLIIVISLISSYEQHQPRNKTYIGTKVDGVLIPPAPDGSHVVIKGDHFPPADDEYSYESNNSEDIGEGIVLILILTIYPLRGAFYLIKWSIKVLKNSDGQTA